MEIEFFTRAVALAALSVVGIQQILKLRIIPIALANKYPVPTNILLSFLVSLFAVWQDMQVKPTAWTGWILLVSLTSVTAAIAYNMTFRNWTQLKAMEGEK